MKENVLKATISAALSVVIVYFNELLIPMTILVAALSIDYITGMVKAWMTASLSSEVGFKGIVKKMGYLLVVCVGMGIDWLVYTTVTTAGVEMRALLLFGMLACIWLIINELISILENLTIIGVPVPSFLFKIIEKLKKSAEDKADRGSDE